MHIMKWRCSFLFLVGAAPLLVAQENAVDYPYLAFDHKSIDYIHGPVDDPVSRLAKRMEKGEAKLEYDPKWGYLPSLLKNLGINRDSQVLVFSKTSFQAPRISPKKPRALYFNDTVAVGSVREGEVYEFASLDPKQGAIYYTLDVDKTDHPEFLRRDMACMQCHMSPATLNVPGILVTSVYTSGDGMPYFRANASVTDGRTAIMDRWGGWYVTGVTGSVTHNGNAVALNPQQPSVLDRRDSQNLTSLAKKLDTSPYLEPTSDIVALMTLEHQTRMVNLMIRLGWETRIAMADGKLEASEPRLAAVTEDLVTYMVFADEAHIWEPIEGVSTFTKTFPERGPRDKKGRSLRDFDLKTKMFRYPLSYMIYSEAFDALPQPAKDRVYRRLYEVLSGKDTSPKFARLSAADRAAALEILIDTKPSLPEYFKRSAPAAGDHLDR